ncbi:MAG TPA: hypothetical protein VKC89_03325 [Patescibacteria group bacterium]|nr:hypothetical protein [Patescibacteria group bacterium]
MPFYKKEGESWTEWDRKPLTFQVGNDPVDEVHLAPTEDPDQVKVSLKGSVVGIIDHGVIFPGPDHEEATITGLGIAFENLGNNSREAIIYSKEPIKGEH